MPSSKLIGLSVKGFDPSGVSILELPVRTELTFDGAVVQGGIVGLLADYAGVSAAACTQPAGWAASTTAFEVHNLAPARGERLVAVGRAVHVGRTSAVSRVDIYAQTSEGVLALIGIATATCRLFEIAKPAVSAGKGVGGG
jgi:uncharacterized protein (TIGR00369 family)